MWWRLWAWPWPPRPAVPASWSRLLHRLTAHNQFIGWHEFCTGWQMIINLMADWSDDLTAPDYDTGWQLINITYVELYWLLYRVTTWLWHNDTGWQHDFDTGWHLLIMTLVDSWWLLFTWSHTSTASPPASHLARPGCPAAAPRPPAVCVAGLERD